MTIRIYKSWLVQFHKWAGFSCDKDLIDLVVRLGFVTLWLSHNNMMVRFVVSGKVR